jgi:hypothetical protein
LRNHWQKRSNCLPAALCCPVHESWFVTEEFRTHTAVEA